MGRPTTRLGWLISLAEYEEFMERQYTCLEDKGAFIFLDEIRCLTE
jgi:hypothetical protein